jgi:hypothetical protein
MSPDEIEAIVRDDNSGVRESILRSIGIFTVALFAISDSPAGERLDLCGTGTLVAIADSRYILTAAHVWERCLRRARQVGITLKEGVDHCFPIDTNALVPVGPPGPPVSDDWGPDSILLRMPVEYVGRIEVYRAFYNLERQRRIRDFQCVNTRVLMGTPEALGDFTQKHADISINGFFVAPDAPCYAHGEFDYVDLSVDLAAPGVPQDFGGVSGGGLWLVQVFESAQAGKLDWHVILEGLAFFQSDVVNGHRVIRCHGQKTIQATAPL